MDYFSDAPRTFKAFLADPRESQFRVGYMRTGEAKGYLDMTMGGQLNVANLIFENGHLLNFAIKGLVSSRFQYGSKSFDLQNSDFIGGFATVFGRNTSFVEFFLSHQSSHAGDDVIAANPSAFQNHSHENVRLMYSREFVFPVRLYAGPEIVVRSDPESLRWKTHFHVGGEYYPDFLKDVVFAAYLSTKQENDWAVDAAVTIGYLLGDGSRVTRRQRLFLEAYNGYSPMGQFSLQRECSVLMGFAFTL